MSELYDVFNEETKPTKGKEYTPKIPKEEYAKKMQEWRNQLFSLANQQTLTAVESPQNYKMYLDLQSRLDYTVTNTLLVMAQYPDAKLVKEGIKWRENGKFIRSSEKEKGIQILEPGTEYMRRDGSIGVNYNPKYVYDVSQLNGKPINIPAPNYTNKEIITALMHRTEIKPQVVTPESELPSPVYFDAEAKKIYVTNGLPPEEMISGLVKEYCMVECAAHGMSRDESAFMVASASYIICQKYGIKGCDESFINNVGQYFEGLDQREVKNELEDIKGLSKSVSDRMEHGIYARQQEQSEKKNEHADVSR